MRTQGTDSVNATLGIRASKVYIADETLTLFKGNFWPEVHPADDYSTWGPVPLPRLPPEEKNNCRIASHAWVDIGLSWDIRKQWRCMSWQIYKIYMRFSQWNLSNHQSILSASNLRVSHSVGKRSLMWVCLLSVFTEQPGSLLPAWMSDYIRYNVWDGITYPFPNFNGATVEVNFGNG